PELLIAHTVSGHTARMISRFKLGTWIHAVSTNPQICRGLQFSYGVKPVQVSKVPKDWKNFLKKLIKCHEIRQGLAVLVEVPSQENPEINHRIEIIADLAKLCSNL
ncbi:MAG: pyruvate kinase alpha/beta domain-containing protein, partial [Candidatus Cloacimonadaceae bacterium]|nr:pyruvate kinase alpha/beta domain-containing protein [Candidatus Cloacimonadaceae bacterium]